MKETTLSQVIRLTEAHAPRTFAGNAAAQEDPGHDVHPPDADGPDDERYIFSTFCEEIFCKVRLLMFVDPLEKMISYLLQRNACQ